MYNRLINFLENHEILFDKQFGFRSKHNTDHTILSIVDKIQNSIEGREYSYGVFLDFSKAFDAVNHKILLMKLEHHGIRGIGNEWFRSYLDNRQQIVIVNDVSSAKCSLQQLQKNINAELINIHTLRTNFLKILKIQT